MRTLATVLLIAIGLTACAPLQTGAGQARIDAAQTYVGPCAASLAGEVMADARRDCLPILVILDGAQ